MTSLCGCSPPITLSDFADIAQVIIAIVNIILALYFFVIQREQNIKADSNTAKLNEQNIKLQWFKELIVQPNLDKFSLFFNNIEGVKRLIIARNMSEIEIVAINRYINDEAKKFRVNFYDVMLKINPELYKTIKTETEKLVSTLTTKISDGNFDLTDNKIFEKEILEPVRYSKHNLVSMIFNYKGN